MKTGEEYLMEAKKWLLDNKADFETDWQLTVNEIVYVAHFLSEVDASKLSGDIARWSNP